MIDTKPKKKSWCIPPSHHYDSLQMSQVNDNHSPTWNTIHPWRFVLPGNRISVSLSGLAWKHLVVTGYSILTSRSMPSSRNRWMKTSKPLTCPLDARLTDKWAFNRQIDTGVRWYSMCLIRIPTAVIILHAPSVSPDSKYAILRCCHII